MPQKENKGEDENEDQQIKAYNIKTNSKLESTYSMDKD